MNPNIHITNPGAFIKTLQDVNCDSSEMGYLDSEDFEIRFYDIDPPLEYNIPDNFPNCCQFHKNVATRIEQLYQRFPFCCQRHSKLAEQSWFNKTNYSGIIQKTLYAIRYTECQICTRIDAEDWYEDITEYFEYCIYSFGQLPAGYAIALGLEIYLSDVIYYLEDLSKQKHEYEEKLNKLVLYLKNYKDEENIAERADINILIGHYQKWLKIFPFDISFFAPLKSRFSNIVPILTGEVSNNRYLKISKRRIVSFDQLIKTLVDVTTEILASTSSYKLLEKGQLTEIENKQIELANTKRRLELEVFTEKVKNGRKQYIKLIKKWLKGEAEYLNTVGPILSKSVQNNIFID
ncbi:hypothetical protein [Pedobacter sp. B4-66]|uniref:hypothetical protein n=1 Tax=Pedobacter sp. B4-66 TaxID=2817280 RepID=UPI001BDA351C|nr:hypothetical protein [Pedobacter sp. B4-66]